MENDAGGSQGFFIGNLLFTKKTGVKVQILQNDKKVDVCVEMQTELW